MKLTRTNLYDRILGRLNSAQPIVEDKVLEMSPDEKYFRLKKTGWVEAAHYQLLSVLKS